MIYPVFEFNLGIFLFSFLVSELAARKFPKMELSLMNGERKIKIHHAYLGALIASLSSLVGQIMLLNIGLGIMFNDIFYHAKKRVTKK